MRFSAASVVSLEDNFSEDNFSEDNFSEDNFSKDNFSEDNLSEEIHLLKIRVWEIDV
jgi:uncharacterized protein YjbI with pentapeptide repeats